MVLKVSHWGVLGGVLILESGLRILIWLPQVPFLVPPKKPKMGLFGCFWAVMGVLKMALRQGDSYFDEIWNFNFYIVSSCSTWSPIFKTVLVFDVRTFLLLAVKFSASMGKIKWPKITSPGSKMVPKVSKQGFQWSQNFDLGTPSAIFGTPQNAQNGSFGVFWGVPKMALGVPESKF